MLQGHVFDSFTRLDQRSHGFYIYSQFLGGQAAAVFLFLTGITFGMGIDRRSDLSPWHRVGAALKRARYLFLLAFLFRLQLFLSGYPHTNTMDILQVDVLNLMGATTAFLSLVALAPDRLARFRWAALAAVLFAALSPVITDFDTSNVPRYLRDYFVPGQWFSMFPWGSFLAFGVAAGSVIPSIDRSAWNRVMQWSAMCGIALIMLGLYCSSLPFSLYPHAEFWVDSPALIACKMGATLLMAAAAFIWTEYLSPGFSFVTLLGRTSLAVYWVHIELVYGNAFWYFKQQLMPLQSLGFAACLIAVMVAMSWVIQRYPWRDWIRRRKPAPEPVEAQLTGSRR